MADKKISQLTALSAANLAPSTDVLAVVDTSATETKKIVAQDLINGVLNVASAVGIGTASPAYKLDVAESGAPTSTNTFSVARISGSDSVANDLTLLGPNTSQVRIKFGDPESATIGEIGYNHPTNSLRFVTNGAEVGVFDSSGNLGIGTSSPSTFGLLAVVKDQTADTAIVVGNGGTSTAATTMSFALSEGGTKQGWFRRYRDGSANTEIGFSDALLFTGNVTGTKAERGRFSAGGDLLVGITGDNDPSSAVVRAGLFSGQRSASSSTVFQAWNQATTGDNVFVQFYTEGGGGTLRGSIDYNRAGGLVRYNTTSDYRAKEVYGLLDDSGETIDALKVYRGKMHGATMERPMLIAHEAQEVAPYAVTGEKDAVNEDGTPKFQQMDTSSLVPLLIAEIQSLRSRVAALEAK